MASLSKTEPSAVHQAPDPLARVGTPEFEAEYRRQMAVIAEHDRRTNFADRMDVDWEALPDWE